jgi:putative N6-adenine-specific DNA methylase
MRGTWSDVWRANLDLRGPSRILARIDSFPVHHLAQLDKRARRVPWAAVLRPDIPFHVEATTSKSRIYHSGAAAERIARAIHEELGAPQSGTAEVVIKARIDNDVCTIAVDTSGELLHKRGHKEAVNKAPMRETMAALFLRRCGYDGHEPVLDAMCGSGTFVIEAAEIAVGLAPGRSRAFAFEKLATFDAAAWQAIRQPRDIKMPAFRFFGRDRDPGAIRMSLANAERAGVTALTRFEECDIAETQPPEGPPGLVILNPPYGDRIGDRGALASLYRTLGQTLAERFHGWRVGLITSDDGLAKATGLPFVRHDPPVLHGGLRVVLSQTGPLP